MFRAALRSTARAARSTPSGSSFAYGSRRLASSSAADKPRTWKGAAVRWGVAIGALYWYNTSPIFADAAVPQTIPAPPQFSDADLPTVESVIEQKRKEAEVKAREAAPPPSAPSEDGQTERSDATAAAHTTAEGLGPIEALEEEADQQAAFDPETGEINWDCPCLGGMAHGPCGEEFKAAFSCFVYSKEDPKGIDCIEKFQGMQECFRKYPEIYGAELGDEDEEGAPATADGEGQQPTEKTEATKPEVGLQATQPGMTPVQPSPEEQKAVSSAVPEKRTTTNQRDAVKKEASNSTDATKQ